MIKPGDEPILGYRIEELLGQGQFGQVWRARSPGNMSLALKFLSLTGRQGWKEFRAIQRVKQIRHAHLMPIVAIWLLDEQGTVISDDALESIAASHQDLDSGSPSTETLVAERPRDSRRPAQLIVATLVANKTLGDRLKECRREGRPGIPVDELLSYMHEAAKGLDFLNSSHHKIGDSLGSVQHCDVKPDNIMLSGGSVVICDFGVAQVLANANSNANATSLGGTPAYMAPECFLSKPSPTTDQYSLAVTYYELRTGKLPFTEQTFAAVYAAHQNASLDFSAATPAEQAVLRQATATDACERFKSCLQFADKLHQAVHPPATTPTRRWTWGMATSLIAVAAVAAAGMATLDWTEPVAAPNIAPARILLAVDPPDAQVTVDGKAVMLDGSGRLTLDAIVGEPVAIGASKSPERLEAKLKIEPVEGDQEHTITLAYSAGHFAQQANELLSAGKFDEAVDALAQAIKLDANSYAVIPQPILRPTDGSAVKCLQVSPTGRWLACGSASGAVRRWSIEPERIADSGEPVHDHSDGVTALAVTDACTASISKESHEISLSREGLETLTLANPDDQAEFKSVVTAGGGRWLVAASEVWDFSPLRGTTTLHAWDLEAENVPAAHRELLQADELDPILASAHEEAWVVLATSPNSEAAPAGAVVRQCWVDSDRQRTLHHQPSDVRAIAVSHDDQWIAVGGGRTPNEGGADGAEYRSTLIDAHGKQTRLMQWGHFDQIASLAFDASGDYVATGGRDGDTQAWRIPAGWNPAQQLGEKPVFLAQHVGHAAVRSVVCPSSGWVACRYEERAALWCSKAENPTPLWISRNEERVTAIATTPDGRWLITGHRDGTICFWPTMRLMLIDRACAAADETPRTPERDKLTRADRSSWKVRRCLWEHARIACDPANRPIATSA